MNYFKLAFRLLLRETRSGELTILLLALIIAVSSSTAISLFANRLHRTMITQAAEFLAADLAVSSSAALPPAWQAKANQLQLKQSQTTEFSTVLMENDEMLLASIKVVSDLYPLRGHLKTTQQHFSDEQIRLKPPQQGEAWIEQRVLSSLKLKLGDNLQVGEKVLTVTRLLTYEPDKRGNLYSLSPRVMMNSQDLAATHIIQAGSHVHYFFQFIGQENNLASFENWLKPQLNVSQRLMDIKEDRPELGTALERAERYLGLTSIMVILIAGVAIAMATRRYSERHFNTSAVLRCLGCQQKQLLRLYSYQFLMLGFIASAVGCLLGWGAQEILLQLLRDLLPTQIAAPSLLAVVFGFCTGLVILFGFAFPPLLRLKNVSALRVLRHELEPVPASAYLVYGLAISLIGGLIFSYTNDLKMTVTLIGGGALMLLVVAVIIYALLHPLRKLLPHLGLNTRFGVQALLREPKTTVNQILAFSMTLVAMLLSFNVSHDLISDWQQQLPENAPNHFVLNIFPHQKQEFEAELKKQKIQNTQLYPIIRGRLVQINNQPVQKIVSKDSQGERATHRDLSLTWSSTLPKDNQLVAGEWWDEKTTEPGLVSIEEKLAKSLKVTLGDSLTFTIGSQQVNARISSIRKVRWDTMKPNFYMVFSPKSLDAYPSTYLTSFYLPRAEKNILNTLVKKYPSITVLEVDLILEQFKTILLQLTQAINALLYFALFAGFTVLFAAVYASLDQRIYQAVLMRTLGANKALLRKNQLIEFSLLGALSGLLAIIIAEVLLFALYHFVLKIEFQANYLLWGLTPVIGATSVTLAGSFGVRKVVKKSPMEILRQN